MDEKKGKKKGEKKIDAKDKEEEYKWRNSEAQEQLRKDLLSGRIPLHDDGTLTAKEAFMMRPEYVKSGWRLWEARLKSLRERILRDYDRAKADADCYVNYTKNRTPSDQSARGYPEWEGSLSQKLLAIDLNEMKEQGRHMTPQELYLLHECHLDFPLQVFRDHIYQKIGTDKYLHTLKVMGKGYGKPYK